MPQYAACLLTTTTHVYAISHSSPNKPVLTPHTFFAHTPIHLWDVACATITCCFTPARALVLPYCYRRLGINHHDLRQWQNYWFLASHKLLYPNKPSLYFFEDRTIKIRLCCNLSRKFEVSTDLAATYAFFYFNSSRLTFPPNTWCSLQLNAH